MIIFFLFINYSCVKKKLCTIIRYDQNPTYLCVKNNDTVYFYYGKYDYSQNPFDKLPSKISDTLLKYKNLGYSIQDGAPFYNNYNGIDCDLCNLKYDSSINFKCFPE